MASRNPDGWGRRAHQWRGRWRAYLTTGYKPDGRPDRTYVYGRTEKECLDNLDDLRRKAQAGLATADREITVAAYVTEWLAQKAVEVSPRTIEIYTTELAHLLPAIGRLKLKGLTAMHVQKAMRAIHGREVRVGKRTVTLSARAANMARTVLSNALEDAVRFDLIPTNPVGKTKPLRHDPTPIQVWTALQVAAFLQACEAGGAAQSALFYTALTTGLRAGELAALEWGDLRGGCLHVQRTADGPGTKTPKTAAANRVIELSSDTLQVLERHRQVLRAERLQSPLVFPTSTGSMVTRHNLRKAIHRWAEAAGVPAIRPHDLRHTYASMAIASGMNPADLARRLGHTDASFTLRRYVHFFEMARPRQAATLQELTGLRATGGTVGGSLRESN